MKNKNPYNWLKWLARISGSLLVAFTLIMFIGEAVEGYRRHPASSMASFTPLVIVIFIIWGVALAGLIVALWKEGLGGFISMGGFIMTYILNLFNKDASMRGDAITIFLIFSIPAILYVIYWKLNKDEIRKENYTNKGENVSAPAQS